MPVRPPRKGASANSGGAADTRKPIARAYFIEGGRRRRWLTPAVARGRTPRAPGSRLVDTVCEVAEVAVEALQREQEAEGGADRLECEGVGDALAAQVVGGGLQRIVALGDL